MTALTEYQRLETFGIWHASPRDQRRDVIVSLGDATLTISDQRMTALSHWSLPAVERLNPGESPACFGPGPDMAEVLELEDETMVAAIEKVRHAIARRRAPPARIQHLVWIVAAVLLLALAVFWLPGALIRQAVTVVPMAKRADLGAALLADVGGLSGSPCDAPLGRRALDRLRARLLPGSSGRVVVLRSGVALSEHLPGGLILLNRRLVEDHDDPAVAAGHILLQAEAAAETDPLRRLLSDAGALASLRLLATGTLSGPVLSAHAERLLTAPLAHPDPAALAERFRAAGLSPAPFVQSLAGSGLAAPLGADAAAPIPRRPILSDGDWVALQGICGD